MFKAKKKHPFRNIVLKFIHFCIASISAQKKKNQAESRIVELFHENEIRESGALKIIQDQYGRAII